MNKLVIAFGLLAVLGFASISANPVPETAEVADVEADSIENVVDLVSASVDSEDKAFDKNPTCSGVSSATDIYILDTNKDNLWCAYNDSLVLKMANTGTNQGLDICKWRYVTCTGGINTVYTLIYQGISGTTKYLYCQTTGTYDFCGKMVLSNPLEDWGQFWIRTSTYGIDTFLAYTINKYAADILGQLGTNINAQYFKTCAQSAINTC